MSLFAMLDEKLDSLYASNCPTQDEEGLQKRKSHFYSLLFCLLLHTVTFLFIEEYHKEVYMLTTTSIVLCIVVVMTVARRNIFYVDVCTTVILVTITPVLTFMSEKYLFFSIAGTWIIPSIILLMTQNYKLTLASFGILVLVMKFYYKRILIHKIEMSSVVEAVEYLDSQVDLLSLTGFFYFFSVLNFNSIVRSKNKVLLETQKGLKAALQQQEAFIYSFSHELRNPMNSLLGNVELASQEVKEKSVLKYLKTAQVCGDILLQLVNNILDTAKADLGNLEVSFVPTNLRETLEKVWTVCSELIKKKRLQGALTISKNIPYNLLLDPHRVTQVLLNLISNSVKFTDEGSIKVKVFWVDRGAVDDACFDPLPYSEEGAFERDETIQPFVGKYFSRRAMEINDYDTLNLDSQRFSQTTQESHNECLSGVLKIVVTDTGCGMSEENANRVFEKFVQVHSDPNKRKIGTGLGLWITKQLVEKMDGDIRVYSKENDGTTFIICLRCELPGVGSPRSPTPRNQSRNILSSRPFSARGTQSLRALVVDDNPANITVTMKFLEKTGVELVKLTNTGSGIVNEYRKQIEEGLVVDLIVVDHDIGSQDAKEACERIRRIEEQARKSACPIILLGSNVSESEIQACIDKKGTVKANYFYRKPLFYKDLENLVIAIKNSKYKRRPSRRFDQMVFTTDGDDSMEQ